MANKITRPVKMQSYRVANKRDDYRQNKSPSPLLKRSEQKYIAIGLIFAGVIISIVGNIVCRLAGIQLENSLAAAIVFAVSWIPITMALRIFSRISKWSKLLNFFMVFMWVVVIIATAITLFRQSKRVAACAIPS